ncbi:hypothetical protein [Alienimonas californiensis]|uniref:Uncharacterized protein n=1 Tax=Alienimonas californiensis TaxID=2527989 RepID=A0A517PEL6_9PLAN|nr:hypothetical protein [Alienimonas californiensis]QDT17817.1 hypothetical protein CA12_39510 [Alienimonas californiensis]
MAERNFSPHAQKAIKRYYDNRPDIDRTKLSELVTNLYLAEPGKAEKLWDRAEDLMTRLEVPPARVKHVMGSRDVAALAKVVEELQ